MPSEPTHSNFGKGIIMNNIWSGIVTVLTAIIGVAIIAVLVSRNARTAQVIQAGAEGFGRMITAATGPVSGGLFGSNYTPSYPQGF